MPPTAPTDRRLPSPRTARSIAHPRLLRLCSHGLSPSCRRRAPPRRGRQRFGRYTQVHQTEPFAAVALEARAFGTTTPLTRAGRAESARLRHDIRSVHTAASAPAIMGRASAPCAAVAGIPDASLALVMVVTSPSSYPLSLGPVLLAGLFTAGLEPDRSGTSCRRRASGTMRALTPAGLAHARQVSPLPLHCRPSIPIPTTSCASMSLCQSHQRIEIGQTAQASPSFGKLAASRRRNGFVILRAARSPPVAPHPASLRRSYLWLHRS